jgi:hypothetical protein
MKSNAELCIELQLAWHRGRIAPEDHALAESLVRSWIHSRGCGYSALQRDLIRRVIAAPIGGVTRTLQSRVSAISCKSSAAMPCIE